MPTPIIAIKRGDAPVSAATIERARFAEMERRGWPEWRRSEALLHGQTDPTSALYQSALATLVAFKADVVETLAINNFNAQLAAYREALARLSRYRLADGQTELAEDQPTGEYDPETGEPIMAPVVIRSAIDPLPATIEQPTYDPETGEQTGTETIPNPLIVTDDAERAAAQAVLDATPAEVVAFDQGG